MKSRCALFLLLVLLTGLTGCNYDSPLTPKATRDVDPRLLGEWVIIDKDSGKTETMQVRQFDKSNYVMTADGDAYGAYHSDFGGLPFLSVQDLNSSARRYVYATAELSADGRQLTLRVVSIKVIPEETKGRAALQKLLKANLKNPALFETPLVFQRKT